MQQAFTSQPHPSSTWHVTPTPLGLHGLTLPAALKVNHKSAKTTHVGHSLCLQECRTILQSVKAKYPATAEFLNALRALTVRRIPTMNAPRDVYAPSNRLMLQILSSYDMSLQQTKKPGWHWTDEQKDTLATAIRKKLIYVPADGPGSCGNITFVDTMADWNELKKGKRPKGRWTVESRKTFTRAPVRAA